MGTLTDIADAVVTDLDAATLSLEFTAARTTAPDIIRKDMGDTLYIYVAPIGFETAPVSRGLTTQRDYTVDLAVMKGVDDSANSTLDPLCALVEEIAEFFAGKKLDSPAARCVAVIAPAVCDPESIRDSLLFIGALSFTFRMVS